jgi:hypothetical protein
VPLRFLLPVLIALPALTPLLFVVMLLTGTPHNPALQQNLLTLYGVVSLVLMFAGLACRRAPEGE